MIEAARAWAAVGAVRVRSLTQLPRIRVSKRTRQIIVDTGEHVRCFAVELAAHVAETRSLRFRKDGDQDWVEVTISADVDVAKLKEAIIKKLPCIDASSVMLHRYDPTTMEIEKVALDDTVTIAKALSTADNCVIVKAAPSKGPLPARTWDNATDFLAALQHTTVHDVDDCQLIRLPSYPGARPVHWPLLASDTLFVRPIFKELYETHLRRFELDPVTHVSRTLLQGMPGIGKSSFGLYVLWRMVTEGHPVMYLYPKGLSPTFVTLGHPVHYENTVRIADGVAPTPFTTKMLLISMPRSASGDYSDNWFHEFEKHSERLYMPEPTREEVLLMAKHCFQHAGEHVSVDKVNERMDRWGPNPRYVLERIDSERDELERELRKLNPMAAWRLVHSSNERNIDPSLLRYEFLDDTHRHVRYRWASPYIEKRVSEMLAEASALTAPS